MNEIGIGAALGLVLPPLVSFLKGRHWPEALNLGLTLVICLIAGAASAAIDGTIELRGDIIHDPEGLLAATGAAFAAATIVYKLYFRDTEMNERLTGGVP